MDLLKMIQSIEDNLTLDSDYEYELTVLNGIEGDLPVYRSLGTPLWKRQEAQEKINSIKQWIKAELEHKKGV